MSISFTHEIKDLKTKIQALRQQENSLRLLAKKYRKQRKK